MIENIYKNKIVLVTGHTGFKGSWLSLWLNELGAKVIGYALPPPTKPSLYTSLGLENKIKSIIADIRDEIKLKEILKKYNPEIIFHLAAQPLVRVSYDDPKLTYETNVIGTLNLLEAVKNTKSVKVVINITTDKVYENKEWIYGYREIDPLGGYDPYSSSKACSEILTASYRNSFFNKNTYKIKHNVVISTVRAGNVIGGGDWALDRLIPDCIRALSKNEKIIIRNPDSTRPWQHVLEPLSGYMILAELMYKYNVKFSGEWNFGPVTNDTLTVEDIVKQIVNLWGTGDYKVIKTKAKHEANLLKLDISKTEHFIKWRPIYDCKTAVKETVNWYKKYHSGYRKMYSYTITQLKKYITDAKKKNINMLPYSCFRI